MAATLRLVGLLKEYAKGQGELAVPPGLSVRETLARLEIPPELVALVVVNEEQQSKDYILQDQDVVRVLAVIGGG